MTATVEIILQDGEGILPNLIDSIEAYKNSAPEQRASCEERFWSRHRIMNAYCKSVADKYELEFLEEKRILDFRPSQR